MENKVIAFENSRELMLNGIAELSKAVSSTLGPRGRNVALYLDHYRMGTTKDGVTVAKFIRFSDPMKDAGARFLQDAANRTVFHAGDGTTTCILLAAQLSARGVRFLDKKDHLMRSFNDGMIAAVRNVINELVNVESEQIDGNFQLIENVAMISANNDKEIGKLIREAMEQVGMLGMIQTDDSLTNESSIKIVDGMEIHNGYLDYSYVNVPSRSTCELGSGRSPVEVFIVDEDLSTIKQMSPILNYIAATEANVVMVVNDIIGEADSIARLNKSEHKMKLCVVRAPGVGERRRAYMRDLAIFTAAKVIGQDTGTEIENFQPEWAGKCEKFVATNKTSRFITGAGTKESVDELISSIESDLKNTKDEFAISKHKERIQRLKGKAAILMVGAPIEQELGQLKDRVDDAIKATQSSIEEGIVPGGGIAYFRISERLMAGITDMNVPDLAWREGYTSVLSALQDPIKKIISNGGDDVKKVMDFLRSPDGKGLGYNAINGRFEDMKKAGVINATKVERVALENALSAATLMLSVQCVIYPEQDGKKG